MSKNKNYEKYCNKRSKVVDRILKIIEKELKVNTTLSLVEQRDRLYANLEFEFRRLKNIDKIENLEILIDSMKHNIKQFSKKDKKKDIPNFKWGMREAFKIIKEDLEEDLQYIKDYPTSKGGWS